MTNTLQPEQTKTRLLSTIAGEILRDWKNVNYAAKPYLYAMQQLETMNDKYLYDSAHSIVAYFLSNAKTWRGETAKRVKKELNDILHNYKESKPASL
jgi:hypothetical protein